MPAINRVPQGLLGLLDAKTQGETPKDSSGVLSPTIDLTPNYLANIPLQIALAVAGASSTIGYKTASQVTVPAGELWYVFAASAQRISTAANGANNISLCLVTANTSGVCHIASFDGGTTSPLANLDSSIAGITFETPLLLNPGNALGCFANKGSAAATTFQTAVIYRPVTV